MDDILLTIPHTINLDERTVSCLRLNEGELRECSFLDERVSPSLMARSITYTIDEFVRMSSSMPDPGAGLRLMMHSGYSGSTAILRAINESEQLVVYREPLALVTVAESYLTGGYPSVGLLRSLLQCYSQVFRPGQIPILKPSSRTLVIYNVFPYLVHSLFLISATKNGFVSSVMKSSVRQEQLLNNCKMAAKKLYQEKDIQVRNTICSDIDNLTVAESLFEYRMIMLKKLASLSGARVENGRDLVNEPELCISMIEVALDITLTDDERSNVMSSKWWCEYAKPLC